MSNNRSLLDELSFFQNLMLDILECRVVLNRFVWELNGKNLTRQNAFLNMLWYGYTVAQISNCRKFFDKDKGSYNFCSLVDEVPRLKDGYDSLFLQWKESQLKKLANKYLLHTDQNPGGTPYVQTVTLNEFIDNLRTYLDKVVEVLYDKYSDVGIGSQSCEGYLKDREQEVEVFFREIRK